MVRPGLIGRIGREGQDAALSHVLYYVRPGGRGGLPRWVAWCGEGVRPAFV